MSISGNLRTMGLADLLQWLDAGNKTGTLLFARPEVEKKIYFRDGVIIGTGSTEPKEYLGHFLVGHGHITEEELSEAMRLQDESKKLLGRILVDMGSIAEPELDQMLRLKSEETIYDMFFWEEADFRFRDGELPAYEMVPAALHVQNLLLEGMHRIDEWRRIREVIPSSQCVPVSVCDLLDDPEIPEPWRHVLAHVDDDRSIEELALQTHASEFLVCQILFDQLRHGRLKVVRPRQVGGDPPPGASADLSSTALMGSAEQYLREGDYARALRHVRAARSLDPDGSNLRRRAHEVEDAIEKLVESSGITPDKVPHLAIDLAELTSLPLSPQEGFILTRINGSYDVKAILKISPMPQLDALVVLSMLQAAGHIELR